MIQSPRAEATAQAILQAAIECIAESGFNATTTRKIAERAGVTQPLVHHYFGSKEAVLQAAVEQVVQDYEQAQTAQWQREGHDAAFFACGLPVLFEWLKQHRTMLRVSLWAQLEKRAFPTAGAVRIFKRVRRQFQAAQGAGLLRADIDLDAALLIIEALFKGYWDRRELFMAYPLRKADIDERYAKQAIRLLITALLTPDAVPDALALLEDPLGRTP